VAVLRHSVPILLCYINCTGAHASNGRECPAHTNEKAIQELNVKDCLSFINFGKKFWKANQRTGNALVIRCLIDVSAAMQTSLVSAHSNFSVLGIIISHAAVSSKVEISTHADDLSIRVILDVRICYKTLALDIGT
jgi:hypothetical protein